jgi:hypothetical protein
MEAFPFFIAWVCVDVYNVNGDITLSKNDVGSPCNKCPLVRRMCRADGVQANLLFPDGELLYRARSLLLGILVHSSCQEDKTA